jgi:hypothetical protein
LLATSGIMLSKKKEKESVKFGVISDIWNGIYHAMRICWMNC